MVSGNVPRDLKDLDKLASMLVSFLFFLFTPSEHGVRWMRGAGGCFGAGDVVFVIYMPHRQRISRVEGRQVQGEEP